MLEDSSASLIGGRLLEATLTAERGVASCGGRLVTARPGGAGKAPARHYDLAARSSLHGSAREMPAVVGRGRPRKRKRGPEAPNRHGGAPRGERPAAWQIATGWRLMPPDAAVHNPLEV